MNNSRGSVIIFLLVVIIILLSIIAYPNLKDNFEKKKASKSNSDNNRSIIVGNLQTLGAQIIMFHRTPKSEGGGGYTPDTYKVSEILRFINWNTSTKYSSEGNYEMKINKDYNVTIKGSGTLKGKDGINPVCAKLTVSFSEASPLKTEIIN